MMVGEITDQRNGDGGDLQSFWSRAQRSAFAIGPSRTLRPLTNSPREERCLGVSQGIGIGGGSGDTSPGGINGDELQPDARQCNAKGSS